MTWKDLESVNKENEEMVNLLVDEMYSKMFCTGDCLLCREAKCQTTKK